MRDLGLLYLNGQGVGQNYFKAREWLKRPSPPAIPARCGVGLGVAVEDQRAPVGGRDILYENGEGEPTSRSIGCDRAGHFTP